MTHNNAPSPPRERPAMKYVLALVCGLLLATMARAENPRCLAEF